MTNKEYNILRDAIKKMGDDMIKSIERHTKETVEILKEVEYKANK